MNRLFFSFFLLFTLTQSAQNLSKLYDEVSPAVVVINILNIEPKKVDDNLTLVTRAKQGSGVLISEDGLIWTAAHVVQLAELVQVEFFDGEVYEAEVLSSNPLADVALIKINGIFKKKNKKVVKIGNSDAQKIGDDIFVLGAPFGLKQTISKGILSGRHTPKGLINDFVKIELLQTDAAINKGSSGSPMFNMKGELIGITSSIYSASGGFNGVGFAISSNTDNKLLMDRPNIWTGMNSILLTGAAAKALNVPQESGLLVLTVSSKGTAAKIGLKGGFIEATIDGVELLIGGDIILNIGGISFGQPNFQKPLRKRQEEFKKGDIMPITILRGGQISVIHFIKE
ncbi:MAG: trypsin-like peptidase domain-containing protein [Lutibacter sp.]|nr:trypsin-like peptidase domain-containing protein [Lutibacter sp.]